MLAPAAPKFRRNPGPSVIVSRDVANGKYSGLDEMMMVGPWSDAISALVRRHLSARTPSAQSKTTASRQPGRGLPETYLMGTSIGHLLLPGVYPT